ncbi:hypothetical protein AAE478_001393 [Parahypoxylon ruwenzoriense]
MASLPINNSAEGDHSDSQYAESEDAIPVFTMFPQLPPEIRIQIWRAAIPYPGINFFNVHCIPNDHPGTNRSTSPSWLYLDLRRMSIDDDDDLVAEYDPSAWLVRDILRHTCREARAACALKPEEAAILTLTRPVRGLFVRAGDGQLRRTTPLYDTKYMPQYAHTQVERLERRMIQICADDVLCLCVENCSFNLPYEEMPAPDGGSMRSSLWPGETADEHEMGWAYDPQLMPKLSTNTPSHRLCVSMTHNSTPALRAADGVLNDLISGSLPKYDLPEVPLIMFDAYEDDTHKPAATWKEELASSAEVFWDRFGDRYIKLPWEPTALPADYRLTKVRPENGNNRERYLASAMLRSPKRLLSSPSA